MGWLIPDRWFLLWVFHVVVGSSWQGLQPLSLTDRSFTWLSDGVCCGLETQLEIFTGNLCLAFPCGLRFIQHGIWSIPVVNILSNLCRSCKDFWKVMEYNSSTICWIYSLSWDPMRVGPALWGVNTRRCGSLQGAEEGGLGRLPQPSRWILMTPFPPKCKIYSVPPKTPEVLSHYISTVRFKA